MTVDKALKRTLYLEAMTKKEQELQLPQIAFIRRDDLNKSLVEAINGLVQKLLGISDSNSRKSCGINEVVCVYTRCGYQGQNNFNENQGRRAL